MDKASDREGREKRERSGIFGIFGMGRRESASEEEIKDMVADAEELEAAEKRMIHDILDLSDTSVREIMKPRVDMILVEDVETGRAALERMRGTGFSRLPVYHDDIDGIEGIVHFKDLIGPLMDGRIDEPVTRFMYDPLFVPETKDVIPLLGEMQDAGQQIAIVVDEYGGTAGLVTVEDIVEEIVGEINDETDRDRGHKLVAKIGPQAWRADGRLPVERALELGWPVAKSCDYETLAGWLMGVLDSVPQAGDVIDVEGYSFKIEKMRRSRISWVRVERVCGEPVVEEKANIRHAQ
ncbi:hemolysin family protein [Adlercreutzia sp. ZJ473]|uniref:hemolysin family protein n=1 Tax=Adlercreutzia sp. ZJ473 TaxID=2722822 RepID=UPI0020A6588F|nr:hemolysin family protein [Adlercreutzia sp. ZJ473]